MSPMTVGMIDELIRARIPDVPCVEITNQSRHSDLAVRTKRSATAFACGARNGVRMMRLASLKYCVEAARLVAISDRPPPVRS